jgi:hypothetical protein
MRKAEDFFNVTCPTFFGFAQKPPFDWCDLIQKKILINNKKRKERVEKCGLTSPF